MTLSLISNQRPQGRKNDEMSNPFKAFIPYVVTLPNAGGGNPAGARNVLTNLDNDDIPDNLITTDPTGGQWRTVGLAECHEGNLIHDLDGAGVLLNVQFNERILPGKVRDEHLANVIADITERQGRKPGKKEYAQLRDQVEFELLPKSHIRRTGVYVLVCPDNTVLVFTSSAKKADDAMAVLGALLNDSHTAAWTLYQVKNDVTSWLTGLAKISHNSCFEPTDAAVLKKAREVIRLKDADLGSLEVMTLIDSDQFDVTEMAMDCMTGDDSDIDSEVYMSIVLNEKLIFKRCLFPDTVLASSTDKGEDGKVAFHSFAYLVAREYRAMLKTLTSELGGQVLQEPSKDTKTTPAANEDDEL